MSAAATPALASATSLPVTRALQRAVLWLVGATSAIVFVEPSPYEIATLAAAVFLFATGLKARLEFIPLIALLVLINLGYSVGAIPHYGETDVFNWILTSWYMATTAIFLAMAIAEDTPARVDMLRRGLVAGGMIASLAAIAGYFNLVPGGHDLLTLYDRARGTFKDPNVLGAFLILPALFALQSAVTERFGKALRNTIAFGVISFAILLAFSRAAWGGLILTSAFMLILTALASRSAAERSRIVLIAVVGAVLAGLLLALLLSFDSISEMFRQRASLDQSYDTGRFGRFGRHVLGAAMALDLPFGIGPLQFHHYFPEDTHNSYLNAFMSGGWLSGICYPVLIVTTVIFGFRYLLVRVPWQRSYLAIFSACLGTVGESFVIDIDHWRHFWIMMGATWGAIAAAQSYERRADPPTRTRAGDQVSTSNVSPA